MVTYVAKRSRRAWRARRVGVAICRVERPGGAADAGRRVGLPIRPEPDRAGGPLPAEGTLHEYHNHKEPDVGKVSWGLAWHLVSRDKSPGTHQAWWEVGTSIT